jgi:hypothetical protein
LIAEALEYLTTPCPAWARRLGYLSEAIAIRHRARRCRGAWAAHLAATRDAILRHAPAQAAEITVLGAGLCHDVPVKALATRCQRLTLVDAVRLRGGPRLPSNARYMTLDVHGAAEALHAGRPLRPRAASPLTGFAAAEVTFSVNLLSQLPLLPVRALRRRGMTPAEADAEAARIMAEHVDDLRALPGRAVLIADAERRTLDPEGKIRTERLAAAAGLPAPTESWLWPVAPPGETGDGSAMETTVGVWIL